MPQTYQAIIVGGWITSIAIAVATAVIIARRSGRHSKSESLVSTWVAYLIGVFFAAFVLVFSQEVVGLSGSPGTPRVLDSILNSLQLFVFGRSNDLDVSLLEWMGPLLPLYAVYNAALYIAAPIGTGGTIVSLIKQLVNVPRMRSQAKKRDFHVFSELNSKSLTLARSLYHDEGTDEHFVVFANVEDVETSLASDAQREGMLCLSQSVSYVADRIGGGARKRTYVFCADDEVANLGDGISLARELANRYEADDPIPYVFMFSSSPVAGAVVDAVSSEVNAPSGTGSQSEPQIKVRLKRVDWIRNTVDIMLDKFPLFATGLDANCLTGSEFSPKLLFDYEPSRRHVLIVGETMFAVEYLKGVLWASQMGEDIKVQIDVVSPDVDTLERRFAFESPEFFADDGRPYQDCHELRFFQFDPQGVEYLDYLRESGTDFGEITHVLVAIDDDLVCAKVARRTREVLEQRRLSMPDVPPAFIAALIEDVELAQSVQLMKARKRLYAIEPVGDAESAYSVNNVFNTPLSRQARHVNRIYSEYDINKKDADFKAAVLEADRGFMESEYNQRSSLASALHRKYSLYLVCRRTGSQAGMEIDWSLPLGSLGKTVKDEYEAYFASSADTSWLSAVEHDRWSAYVATEGHEYASFDQVSQIWNLEERHNYELGHLHPCLIGFDDLPALDDAVEAFKGESPQFQKIDDNVIRAIGIIAADKQSFDSEWKRFFD